jgi:hypothetical protein
MVYFRELPAPICELDPAFVDIFFEFANTFTEESVLYAEIKQRKEKAKEPTSDVMRSIGYSEADIAGMDIER